MDMDGLVGRERAAVVHQPWRPQVRDAGQVVETPEQKRFRQIEAITRANWVIKMVAAKDKRG
jgi:hypothetical protein